MDYLSINIEKIRRGDLFWESEQGQDALFIATSDAQHEKHGVAVEGREIPGGKPQRFFENDRACGYGPKLYNHPQYTCPDWSALLAGLAAIMQDEISEINNQATAREAGLQLAATQYSESRDHWLTEARRAEQEIARLRGVIDSVIDLADQNLNGITMGTRIKHHVTTALETQIRICGD